jgi:hypothetical protein
MKISPQLRMAEMMTSDTAFIHDHLSRDDLELAVFLFPWGDRQGLVGISGVSSFSA